MRSCGIISVATGLFLAFTLGCQSAGNSNLPVKGRSPGQSAGARTHGGPSRPAPLENAPPRVLMEARIVHGVGPASDGVLVGAKTESDKQYKALFGGTQGSINSPESLYEIDLKDKWVYVNVEYSNEQRMMRWPIVVTQTIGIGADGTTFIVQRDSADDNSPQTVYCLKGKVKVYSRSSGAVIAEVKENEFVTTTCAAAPAAAGECALVVAGPTTIPADPADPRRVFVTEVQALAKKFGADVLYP